VQEAGEGFNAAAICVNRLRRQFSFLRFIVGMITEFLFALESDNEAAQVMTGNAGYVLLVRIQEIGKIAR
jgi:hypothetical protein